MPGAEQVHGTRRRRGLGREDGVKQGATSKQESWCGLRKAAVVRCPGPLRLR
jgi:hypothetical protein